MIVMNLLSSLHFVIIKKFGVLVNRLFQNPLRITTPPSAIEKDLGREIGNGFQGDYSFGGGANDYHGSKIITPFS